MAHELAILQAARLKRRLSPELAAASAGVDLDTAQDVIARLRDEGSLSEPGHGAGQIPGDAAHQRRAKERLQRVRHAGSMHRLGDNVLSAI